MPIAFDAAGGSVGSAAATVATATHTHTMGSVSNGVAFVGINNQNGGGLSSVTFGGNAMTLVGSRTDSDGFMIYLYVILNPSAGANTVSVTRNTTTNAMRVMSVSYSGVKQTTTMDATTSGNATSTSLTGTLATVLDNCWTVLVANSNNGSQAAGSGSTRRVDNGGFRGMFDSNGPKTPAGSTSMTVTSASGPYAYVMASFAPAMEEIVLTETVTSTDTVARTGSFVRSLTENATGTDTVVATKVTTLNRAEEVVLSDTVSTTLTALRSLIETATLTDTFLKTAAFVRVLVETGTFTPSVVTARVLPFAITETTALVDSVFTTSAFIRSLTDTVQISDLSVALSGVWIPRVKPTSMWTDRTKPTTTWS